MRHLFRASVKTAVRNWSSLLLFEMIYKMLGTTVLYDLLDGIMNAVLEVSGVSYISQANIGDVLLTPAAGLLLLGAFALLACYVYFEIAALHLCCEAGWRGERISVWALFWRAAARAPKSVHFENFPLLFALAPAMMLSFLPLTGGILNGFRMPEFIVDYLMASPALSLSYAALLAGLQVFLFFFLFGFPFVILEKQSFAASWRSSLSLLKGRKIRTAARLLGFLVCVTALFLCAALAVVLGLAVLLKRFVPAEEAPIVFAFYYRQWSRVGNLLYGIFLPVCLCAFVVTLFHEYRGEATPRRELGTDTQAERTGKLHAKPQEIPNKTRQPGRKLPGMRVAAGRLAVAAGTVLLLFLFVETDTGGNRVFPSRSDALVVAHRAGALTAPENTLAALRLAAEAGADMAEIDVQQTSDGVLVVMHDSNFKRTAGFDSPVWETDYETVRGLDAGSSFSSAFAGEPVPTLEQMLKAAKGKIRLMIELKSTGHERGLEEKTVELIRENGMEEDCTVASMDLDILRRVKSLAPEIRTTFITAVLYASLYDMEEADVYSVEATSLSRVLVEAAHAQGREVYAWTANTERNILKILRSGADGIVTDNPELAAYYLEDLEKDLFLDWLTEIFFPETK